MFKYTTAIVKNITTASLTVALLSAASLTQAQTISPAMIEQFKNLPRPQQEALAKQYGINLSDLGLGATQAGTRLAAPGESIEQVDTEQMALEKALKERLAEKEKAEQEEEGELPRYGIALFDRDVSTFAPTDNAQVPDDYRLGVGDELVVQLFGKDNDQLNLEVNREGQVSFPKLGPVNVAGFTFEDAKTLIKQRVAEQLIGVEAVVSIGRLRAINVFMAGEVVVPGAYSLSALATVSQALYQAGGVTDIGTLRNIQVKRNGNIVADFDVYDLLLRGDASSDVRLRSGDVVFVPPYDRLVTVEGEVKRPMRYEVESNETIANAIAMAGGFKSSAFKGTAVLVQQGGTNGLPVVKNIALNNKNALSSRLSDGDSIRIMPIGESLDDAVLVKGAVVRPGAYGWQEGLRVSDIIGDI
ncbi:MAG TPA: polysaccharide biosynthesis/export family protein, partial [Pseudomonadales bacterium]|nr:polysaccharide biosynthesis/export family protein [Pseudomonadales bacterium]